VPSWEGSAGDCAHIRLDRYVAENLKLLSRSQIKARNLQAWVNGKKVKISHLLKANDSLSLSWDAAPLIELIPENLPLDVIYEDERVIVINKAQGMSVHPGAGIHQGTVVNALLYRRPIQARDLRPGIVHRLDKDTSGVMIAAWDEAAHAFLAAQFKERTVRKTYAAIVCGAPKQSRGSIESYICRDSRNRKLFTVSASKGKHALTLYKLLWTRCNYSFLLVRPRSGRTHQIRVHLKSIGCPIAGDPLYNPGSGPSLLLHALSLRIVLPGQTQQSLFRAPLPERFRSFIP
jgi:23S rRNA pseudouridine1911/1915/1917 synthase